MGKTQSPGQFGQRHRSTANTPLPSRCKWYLPAHIPRAPEAKCSLSFEMLRRKNLKWDSAVCCIPNEEGKKDWPGEDGEDGSLLYGYPLSLKDIRQISANRSPLNTPTQFQRIEHVSGFVQQLVKPVDFRVPSCGSKTISLWMVNIANQWWIRTKWPNRGCIILPEPEPQLVIKTHHPSPSNFWWLCIPNCWQCSWEKWWKSTCTIGLFNGFYFTLQC